jgi:integrase
MRYERILGHVKRDPELREEDRKLILKFDRQCTASGLSAGRKASYLDCLRTASKRLQVPLSKVAKDGVVDFMREISGMNYSESTVKNYKVAFKRFYAWLRGCEPGEYPPEVRWIKTSLKNRNRLPRDSLISRSDLDRMVRAADNLRDKAFLRVLYESGCRIGEILSLRIKHVKFDRYGAILVVHGKTGDRAVRIIASAPALANWIENHPEGNNPEAPLWISIGTKSRGSGITRTGVGQVLRRVVKRAGLRKRIYPHLFRHSRATDLASGLTEGVMKQYFGWTPGSRMPGIYVHLASRDVDRELLKLHGIEVGEAEPKFKVIRCPRCGLDNSPGAQFCSKCALPLSMRALTDLERKRKRAKDLLDVLFQDPEVRELTERKLRELRRAGKI